MGPIGVPEMLFILAFALLIFGPRRLPELGRTIGKAMGEFRRATTELKRSIDVEIAEDPAPRPAVAAPRPTVARGTQETVEATDEGESGDDEKASE